MASPCICWARTHDLPVPWMNFSFTYGELFADGPLELEGLAWFSEGRDR